jgi:MYXO-CTERM domain-containing protein
MLLGLIGVALASPILGTPRGWQDAPVRLELQAEHGGTLLYSLDGSAPTLPYAAPLDISTTTIVRAVELGADGTPSSVVTATYLFPDAVIASPVMDPAITGHPTYGPVVRATLRDLPVVSLVAPGGITMSEGPVSLEWIDPAGDSVQVDAGAYVSGGTSWAYPKTSFRLLFRSDYGPGRLDADLYGEDATGVPAVDTFDAISLRSGNHDTVHYLGARGQHLRNFWMDESQLEMGHVVPHGRFVHVFLNGAYHGMYHLRERFNAAMMADYLGGSEDDYEALTAGNAFDGSGAAWAAVRAASGDYETVREWVNIPHYLDYMVLNYYAANAWDWYSWHNWQAVGPTRPGRGGFRFHSSDSDICLYYDANTDILHLGGPSDVFLGLLQEAHPDFLVALRDAIHRNLTGPLSAEAAAARYERLAAQAEDAVVAESARWGYGWWDRDEEWVTERDNLLTNFFPYRTDMLWAQMRAAGWYPVEAPLLDTPGGPVSAGASVLVEAPPESAAELWVTVDGADPRALGGAPSPSAMGPDGARAVNVAHTTRVRARLRDGSEWGPLVEATYEVDEPPPVVLNEWNAVSEDAWLDGTNGAGRDAALGRVQGNGGDWLELLILQDVDLRGWRLTMTDRNGDAGTLTLSDAPLLADVRAGTIVTIAEDLPEDAGYAPERGDWRFHLRAGESGSGGYVSATPFDVTSHAWQLVIQDAEGHVRFGPAGEGVEPRDGLSSREVGALKATPTPATRAIDTAYGAASSSTFGAPNVWDESAQDLAALRGETGTVVDLDEDTDPPRTRRSTVEPAGCGCATPSAHAGAPLLAWLSALGAALARRRSR